ncbi:glutathione S-transferase theta-1-like [Anneissia japonica]|uniref:glutathione S-transferase theta-1-like n=1 Tax=Anneissia japonica TaxID=1529436 RepID=UPI0014258CA7|nr:glutathione S-transferase theta-1-like [Anneissia japonica]
MNFRRSSMMVLPSSGGTGARRSSCVLLSSAGLPQEPVTVYVVRLSPPCRAVWIYLAQNKIPYNLIDVDYSQNNPDLAEKNPHESVPTMIDGDIVVFEGQAILRYLSSRYTNYASYGSTLAQRMQVESVIAWASSELHRIVGYRCAYPQSLEKYSLASRAATEVLVKSGIEQLITTLETLEKHYLKDKSFLCGNRLTMADIVVATTLIQAEWVGFSFRMWPKVSKWLHAVAKVEFWEDVHKTHDEYVKELKEALD